MPDGNMYPRIQFRSSEILDRELAARSDESLSVHTVAKRDLERYYEMLQRSLPSFTQGEAMLLVDVLNGTLHLSYSMHLIWAEVSDALKEGYAEKWEVDGTALVEKLRELTPFECMAVADAVERAWNSTTYQVSNLEEKVRQIGLIQK